MRLEDQIIEDLSRNMASAMDTHILAGVLIESGWKEVIVDPWVHGSANDIKEWCDEFVQGQHIKTDNRWMFEDAKDATMFALKWG